MEIGKRGEVLREAVETADDEAWHAREELNLQEAVGCCSFFVLSASSDAIEVEGGDHAAALAAAENKVEDPACAALRLELVHPCSDGSDSPSSVSARNGWAQEDAFVISILELELGVFDLIGRGAVLLYEGRPGSPGCNAMGMRPHRSNVFGFHEEPVVDVPGRLLRIKGGLAVQPMGGECAGHLFYKIGEDSLVEGWAPQGQAGARCQW